MYELSSGYLRGICGASSGRGGAEESCYKGTKKNRDMQTIRNKISLKSKLLLIFFANVHFL